MTTSTTIDVKQLLSVYKHTLILGILCLITIVPIGILLILITLIDHGSFICLNMGIFLLLLSILVWLNAFKFRLDLYTDGLSKRNIFGSRHVKINAKTKFLHRNVSEFVNGVPAGQHVFITVKDDASSIRLNSNIKNINTLQTELMNLELKHVTPYYVSQYKNGKRIDFGTFKLQDDQLYYKNKVISLKEISSFTLADGKLKIKQLDKKFAFCSAPVSKIYNMTTFFNLIEYATTEHTGR